MMIRLVLLATISAIIGYVEGSQVKEGSWEEIDSGLKVSPLRDDVTLRQIRQSGIGSTSKAVLTQEDEEEVRRETAHHIRQTAESEILTDVEGADEQPESPPKKPVSEQLAEKPKPKAERKRKRSDEKKRPRDTLAARVFSGLHHTEEEAQKQAKTGLKQTQKVVDDVLSEEGSKAKDAKPKRKPKGKRKSGSYSDIKEKAAPESNGINSEELLQRSYTTNSRAGKVPWRPPLATSLDMDRQELLEMNYKAYHELL